MSVTYSSGSLGPLTAPVALPSCSVWYYSGTGTVNEAIYFASNRDGLVTSCYPADFKTDSMYSPGVCPEGWSSACPVTPKENWLQYPLQASETGVMCCPLGFICSGAIAWCSHVGKAFSGQPIYGLDFSSPTLIAATAGDFITYTVSGKPILVAYKATDTAIAAYFAGSTAALSVVSQTSASASSTSTIASATSAASESAANESAMTDSLVSSVSSTSAMPPTSSAPATGSSGLSLGAKIGIGVAIPLVAIIAGLLLWIFILYRKKHKSKNLRAGSPPEIADASARPQQHAWNGQDRYQPVTGASAAQRIESEMHYGPVSRQQPVEDRREPSRPLHFEQRPVSPIYGFEPVGSPTRPV